MPTPTGSKDLLGKQHGLGTPGSARPPDAYGPAAAPAPADTALSQPGSVRLLSVLFSSWEDSEESEPEDATSEPEDATLNLSASTLNDLAPANTTQSPGHALGVLNLKPCSWGRIGRFIATVRQGRLRISGGGVGHRVRTMGAALGGATGSRC
jgi:hypothetical protein